MRKLSIILLFLFSFKTGYAQEFSTKFTIENFENQILNYNPDKNPNVPDKDYKYGIMILEETKGAVKNQAENFNLADYFNLLSAFLSLKETKENINIAFRKFVGTKGSCEYILSLESSIKNNPKYDIIREDYNKVLIKCKSNIVIEKKFDLLEYCKSNNLDFSLVEKIYNIGVKDQKYRSSDNIKKFSNKLQLLDKENQSAIDSLYKKHKTYIGRSLVGQELENVMWTVIQHANIEMMEKYLPIIKTAVIEKELEVGPLKMLIDRFYGLKYGYQIFGSQGEGSGFKLPDEKTKKEIKMKYGID